MHKEKINHEQYNWAMVRMDWNSCRDNRFLLATGMDGSSCSRSRNHRAIFPTERTQLDSDYYWGNCVSPATFIIRKCNNSDNRQRRPVMMKIFNKLISEG